MTDTLLEHLGPLGYIAIGAMLALYLVTTILFADQIKNMKICKAVAKVCGEKATFVMYNIFIIGIIAIIAGIILTTSH